MTAVRTFEFQRDRDLTGVSGTGVVADGAVFDDGTTVVRWRGERRSTVVWSSVEEAIAVHGHDGATRLVWTDQGAESTEEDGAPFGPSPTLTPTTRCRSCRALVAWYRTPAGKRIPLDPMAEMHGNVVLHEGVAVALSADALAEVGVDVPRYVSHFATCPDANTWRSKGGDRG